MHFVFFALLMLPQRALALDTGDSCPTPDDVCADECLSDEGATCCISSAVTLPRGCDVDWPDEAIRITPDGSLTLTHPAEITARSFTVQSSRDGSASVIADCDDGCGEVRMNLSEHFAMLGQMDFSANPKGGSAHETASSLRVESASSVIIGPDSTLNLKGAEAAGVGGSLTLSGASIEIAGEVMVDGSPSGLGTAGDIVLNAANITVMGEITANALATGSIGMNATDALLLGEGSNIVALSGNPIGFGGDMHFKGATVTVAGTVSVSRRGSTNAGGGHVWMEADDDFILEDSGEIFLKGGSSSVGGTLRIDGSDVNMAGTISAKISGSAPQRGGKVSIVARDTLNVSGPISTGGTERGGIISLVALDSIWVDANLNAGDGPYGLISMHSRNGSIVLDGDHTAAKEAPTEEEPGTPAGFILDACYLSFNAEVKIEAENGTIEMRGRSKVETTAPYPWTIGSTDGTGILRATGIRMISKTDALAPDSAFLMGFELYGTLDITPDPSLDKCGDFDMEDMDGDGHGWDRLGEGYDCDDYNASINPDALESVEEDGIDRNCLCEDSTGMAHAYARWIQRYDESILLACDIDDITAETDADEGPPPEDTGAAETGTPPEDPDPETEPESDPSGIDTASPSTKYSDLNDMDYPRYCGCAAISVRPAVWPVAVLLLGLISRRRRHQ